MGTEFRIVVHAPDSGIARTATDLAYRRIDEINTVISNYDPESELSRLSAIAGRDSAAAVSPRLWELLARAQQIARETGGAFDITLGRVTRLWRRAVRRQSMPDSLALAKALAASGNQYLVLDSLTQTVRITVPGLLLDPGGIGKGFAADKSLAVLDSLGLRSALVDAGGDMAIGAPPPGAEGWRVAMSQESGPAEPQVRYLSHCGVAGSGDSFQYLTDGHSRFAHIVDGQTGMGVENSVPATIVAVDATTADALATAAVVSGANQ